MYAKIRVALLQYILKITKTCFQFTKKVKPKLK